MVITHLWGMAIRDEVYDHVSAPGWLTIIVEDDGPGLPEGTEVMVLGRGVRLDEAMPGT